MAIIIPIESSIKSQELALEEFISPINSLSKSPLEDRIEMIQNTTLELVKQNKPEDFRLFLYQQLDHYQSVSKVHDKATLVLTELKEYINVSESQKSIDKFNVFVVQKSKLSNSLDKLSSLMESMKKNLNNSAYELEKMEGKIGYFDWIPNLFGYAYFTRALDGFTKENQIRRENQKAAQRILNDTAQREEQKEEEVLTLSNTQSTNNLNRETCKTVIDEIVTRVVEGNVSSTPLSNPQPSKIGSSSTANNSRDKEPAEETVTRTFTPGGSQTRTYAEVLKRANLLDNQKSANRNKFATSFPLKTGSPP